MTLKSTIPITYTKTNQHKNQIISLKNVKLHENNNNQTHITYIHKSDRIYKPLMFQNHIWPTGGRKKTAWESQALANEKPSPPPEKQRNHRKTSRRRTNDRRLGFWEYISTSLSLMLASLSSIYSPLLLLLLTNSPIYNILLIIIREYNQSLTHTHTHIINITSFLINEQNEQIFKCYQKLFIVTTYLFNQ